MYALRTAAHLDTRSDCWLISLSLKSCARLPADQLESLVPINREQSAQLRRTSALLNGLETLSLLLLLLLSIALTRFQAPYSPRVQLLLFCLVGVPTLLFALFIVLRVSQRLGSAARKHRQRLTSLTPRCCRACCARFRPRLAAVPGDGDGDGDGDRAQPLLTGAGGDIQGGSGGRADPSDDLEDDNSSINATAGARGPEMQRLSISQPRG